MPSLAKAILFSAAISLLSLCAFPVLAQLNTDVNGYGLASGDLKSNLDKIINTFLGIVGVIAVIAVIYGGIRYVISGGNESEAEKAKHTILYAVIGLIIIGLAAVIVSFTLKAVKGGAAGASQDEPAPSAQQQLEDINVDEPLNLPTERPAPDPFTPVTSVPPDPFSQPTNPNDFTGQCPPGKFWSPTIGCV